MLRAGGTGARGWGTRKSKNVREIPHPPRRVRNDKEQRLDSGGWKSEIRDRRLEETGWGAGRTEGRAQIRVRQHGQNKRRTRGAKSGSTATLGCAGMFYLKRTGRSACATRTNDPPSLPRTGSLRLRSGQAGQVREDGARGRALCGTTEVVP